jgi:transcriptional regulator with XRE-family HTH domain
MNPARLSMSEAFSKVVTKHREKKKMSRSALAAKAGLHQTYVGLLERGLRSPSIDTAKAIAGALGLSLGDFIAEVEKLHKTSG